MIKPRLDQLPWDVLAVVDIDKENFIAAAIRWWNRDTDNLPCAVPFESLHGVGRVFAHGAEKYPAKGGRSWETDAPYTSASVQFAALMSHAYNDGIEAESGLMHEWHAFARYVMLSALVMRGTVVDDRPPRVARREYEIDLSTMVQGGDA